MTRDTCGGEWKIKYTWDMQVAAYVEDVKRIIPRCCWSISKTRQFTDLTIVISLMKAVTINVVQMFVRHVYVERQRRRGEHRSTVVFRAKHWIASGAGRPYGHQDWFLHGPLQSCKQNQINNISRLLLLFLFFFWYHWYWYLLNRNL